MNPIKKFAHGKDDDLMLVSYVDKKKSGKNNVVVLTSMHDNVRVTKDKRRKPQVHTFYDHKKGSVDVLDFISSNRSTSIKSKRWPLNSLAFILDTARTNANTILKENNVKTSTTYLYTNLQEKSSMPTQCSAPIQFIKWNTSQPNHEDKTVHPIENKEQTRRCYMCVENPWYSFIHIKKKQAQ